MCLMDSSLLSGTRIHIKDNVLFFPWIGKGEILAIIIPFLFYYFAVSVRSYSPIKIHHFRYSGVSGYSGFSN